MKRFLPSRFLIFAGVLGIAAGAVPTNQDITKVSKKFDLRESILRKFMKDKDYPVHDYAGVFISEADANGLDWRLLPSLAIVESTGGRYARQNNLFGWANGAVGFNSIADAIHQVASALSHGKAYRGKDLVGKLYTYNHSTDYKAMVLAVMAQISPTVRVQAAD